MVNETKYKLLTFHVYFRSTGGPDVTVTRIFNSSVYMLPHQNRTISYMNTTLGSMCGGKVTRRSCRVVAGVCCVNDDGSSFIYYLRCSIKI